MTLLGDSLRSTMAGGFMPVGVGDGRRAHTGQDPGTLQRWSAGLAGRDGDWVGESVLALDLVSAGVGDGRRWVGVSHLLPGGDAVVQAISAM